MTNLTISLDENTVRKARLRAIEEGTSVSAKVREFLARYARGENGDAADSAAGAVKLPVFNGGQGLAPGLGQHVAEPFDQGRTVVKPGQRIVLGQIADACLLPLAFGQLAQRHQQI